jgi:hypothetical protein
MGGSARVSKKENDWHYREMMMNPFQQKMGTNVLDEPLSA